MPTITLNLEQPVWPDIADKAVIHYQDPIQMSALPDGMESGKPSVAMRFDLPDGQVVVAETSLAVLVAAVRAIGSEFGEHLCPPIDPTVEIAVAALAAVIPDHINVTTATGMTPLGMQSVAVLIGDDGEHYQHYAGSTLPEAVNGLLTMVRNDMQRHMHEGHEDPEGTVH